MIPGWWLVVALAIGPSTGWLGAADPGAVPQDPAGGGRAGATGASASPADLVLHGGRVYTVDAARSWAEAVAIRDGRLVFVGSDGDVGAWIGAGTRVLDLAGKMVLPGFGDAHVHLALGGIELGQCDLNGAADVAEIEARVGACVAAVEADAARAGEWIVGGGWDLPLFPAANPTRQALDRLVGERPAVLTAADGHSAWVSSAALARAGITATTADPVGGRIERDPATGAPSGTLRESAIELVTRLLPEPGAEERRAGLRRAIGLAHQAGITGIFDPGAEAADVATYRELDRRGELGLHVAAAVTLDPERPLAEQVAALTVLAAENRGPRVRLLGAKLFADGVIEARTAALLAPYLGGDGAGGDAGDRDDSRGELLWSEERLREAALAVDRAGLELHVHAIGDRAIRTSLDAIAGLRTANGARERRPTIAHLQLFDPADVSRLGALGVIASFQPLWAYADAYIRELTEPVLGAERSRWLYPLASVAAGGAVLAAGSDWTVSSIAPLAAIEVALTRRDPTAGPGPAWIPEERVNLPTMLAAYSIGPAYASFREGETGSLEVGKAADLVVLERDLFAIPAHEISETRVLLTVFGGREVWRDPSF